ncbi:MAG: hypothetical protein QME66_05990 [Candidatus Eisenbacteria bacterium]|nr:hypothetical protein [Candidatus Eisenbacteria bacterium]
MWPWRNYLKSSILVSKDDLSTALGKFSPGRETSFRDKAYTVTGEKSLVGLVERHSRVFRFKYGGNKRAGSDGDDSYPDCDDFAFMECADINRAAILSGFKAPPAYGRIWYRTVRGGWHEACFGFVLPLRFCLHDPLSGRWCFDGEAEKEIAEAIEFNIP